MTSRPARLLRSFPLVLAMVLAACSAGATPADDPTAVAATGAAGAEEAPSPATTPSPTPDPEVLAAAEAEREQAALEVARDVARAEQWAMEVERKAAAEARRAAEAARRRAEIRTVQEVLAANGYYAGAVDGEVGAATTSAVLAFQKVHGLSRDGVIGPATLAAVESPVSPPLAGGAPTRIEIDLDRQVVHLVRGGQRVRTMNASSGNGEVYRWPDGRLARADTPVGTFTILRRITGLRDGDLGAMYDPMYFHEGWAIHGSNSVPGYPASHGCVRLSRSDALWLASQVPNGTQVVVHGRVNAFDPGSESVWLEG